MSEEEVLVELKRLNASVRLAFWSEIAEGLEQTASTVDRRRIWAAIDGRRQSKEISTELGIPRRTVDSFLLIAASQGLIINHYGKAPVRLLDFVPPAWNQTKATAKDSSHAAPTEV